MKKLIIQESKNEEGYEGTIKQSIIDGVRAYNVPYFGHFVPEPFLLYIKDDAEKLIAGIVGDIVQKYVRVSWVWVDVACRGQNLGTQLLCHLEEFSRRKGCQYIQLETFDFQARPFYEKLGFACKGTIPQWIEGRDVHFMQKILVD